MWRKFKKIIKYQLLVRVVLIIALIFSVGCKENKPKEDPIDTSGLEKQIGDLDGKIKALAKPENNKEEIKKVNEAITAIQTSLSLIEKTIKDLKVLKNSPADKQQNIDIATLQKNLIAFQEQLKNMPAGINPERITQIEKLSVDISTRLKAVEESLKNNQTDQGLKEAKERITALQLDMQTLQESLKLLPEDMQNLKDGLLLLQKDIDEIKADLQALQDTAGPEEMTGNIGEDTDQSDSSEAQTGDTGNQEIDTQDIEYVQLLGEWDVLLRKSRVIAHYLGSDCLEDSKKEPYLGFANLNCTSKSGKVDCAFKETSLYVDEEQSFMEEIQLLSKDAWKSMALEFFEDGRVQGVYKNPKENPCIESYDVFLQKKNTADVSITDLYAYSIFASQDNKADYSVFERDVILPYSLEKVFDDRYAVVLIDKNNPQESSNYEYGKITLNEDQEWALQSISWTQDPDSGQKIEVVQDLGLLQDLDEDITNKLIVDKFLMEIISAMPDISPYLVSALEYTNYIYNSEIPLSMTQIPDL